MGLTPLSFTGISQYSQDLQTILNRAVSIANLPVQQMQNEQTGLLSRKQLLSDLGVSVSSLASAVAGLGVVGQTRSLTATSSNANRVAITDGGATVPATYTITDITSVAKAASEITANGYATADSTTVASGDMELVLGNGPDDAHLITLGEGQNNLNGLADAINQLGIGVSATVLNTGTGVTPYYLSLTAAATGATTLQLRTTPGNAATNLLTATNQGADAVFKLDGIDVQKPDNVVTGVIPNVTFTIASETDPNESVVLSLSSDRSRLANALNALVTAYNDVAGKVNAQIGPTAGLLSGDGVVREVQRNLRSLTGYRGSGSGSIESLADLGIELDKNGVMSFSSSKFYSLSNAQIGDAFTFLGSATSGLGGLSSTLNQVVDPVVGLIKVQQDQYDAADQRLSSQISTVTDRINAMQTSLSAKLKAADALLAALASQQSMLSASLQSVNYVLYGKQQST